MPSASSRCLVALVSGLGWHVQDLQRAAIAQGVRFHPVPFPSLTGHIEAGSTRMKSGRLDLGSADGVVVRMMPPGTLEQVVFRMDALHRLVAAGVPILNSPSAVEASVDKYLATARLAAAGLPVPPTWAGERADDALEAFESLGGDVVIKPLFGSEGRGLVRVSDPELARRACQTLSRLGAVLYLQRFIPHPGHDFRVFVLGGRVLGAIRRHAPAGDWRTNISLGGRAESISIDPELGRLALQAAEAVGASMAGVDLLPGRDGSLQVIEVNAVPGWKALAAATGLDVAAEIVREVMGRP